MKERGGGAREIVREMGRKERKKEREIKNKRESEKST